jgi:hypothetical protein
MVEGQLDERDEVVPQVYGKGNVTCTDARVEIM